MDDRSFSTRTTLPDPQEILRKYGPYLSKTDTVPRPTEDDFRYIRDDQRRREAVTEARAQWDRADKYRAQIVKGVTERKAEREAVEQAAKDARAAAQLETRKTEHAAIEDQLKTAYMRQPGALESDWERDKERVISDYLVSQMGRADAEAREASFLRARQAW